MHLHLSRGSFFLFLSLSLSFTFTHTYPSPLPLRFPPCRPSLSIHPFLSLSLALALRYSTVTVQRIMPQTLDESNYNCALQISDRHSSSSRHSGLDSSPRHSDDLGYYRSGSPLRHSGLDSSMVAQTKKYARSPVNKHTVPGPTSTYTQPTDKITYGDHHYRYSDDSVALPLWP